MIEVFYDKSNHSIHAYNQKTSYTVQEQSAPDSYSWAEQAARNVASAPFQVRWISTTTLADKSKIYIFEEV